MRERSNGAGQLRLIASVILLVLALASSAAAQSASPSPHPRSKKTGHAVFILDFDRASGRVTNVYVIQSTGDAKLDAASIATFKRWRCKPGVYTRVKVPVTYTLQDGQSR